MCRVLCLDANACVSYVHSTTWKACRSILFHTFFCCMGIRPDPFTIAGPMCLKGTKQQAIQECASHYCWNSTRILLFVYLGAPNCARKPPGMLLQRGYVDKCMPSDFRFSLHISQNAACRQRFTLKSCKKPCPH